MKTNLITISALIITQVAVAQMSSRSANDLQLVLNQSDESNIVNKQILNLNKNNFIYPSNSFLVKSLEIDNSYSNYTPLSNSENTVMYFTSRRAQNIGNKTTINGTNDAEDIYCVKKIENGKWGEAFPITGEINTSKNEAITWLSNDGNRMLLCRDENIFESHQMEGVWSKPIPVKQINSDFRETHASYSEDGQAIFFTTDNPVIATIGGLDICVVYKQLDGNWSQPFLVESINSEFNEECPTLLKDNKTLYFTSQGFSSLGGYDIFISKMVNGYFSSPVNMGSDINTIGNEPFVSLANSGNTIYFSSDKKNANGFEQLFQATSITNIRIPLLIETYDSQTNLKINTNISLIDKANQDQNLDLSNLSKGVFGDVNVNFNKSYQIIIEATGYEDKVLSFETNDLLAYNSDSLFIVQKVFLNPIKVELKPLITTLYFDFGKTDICSSSLAIVDNLKEYLILNPSFNIVVKAHTDNVGSNESNKTLSQKRSQSIADWFIVNGIEATRINIDGLGEDFPVNANDNDQNRAYNRRADVIILR